MGLIGNFQGRTMAGGRIIGGSVAPSGHRHASEWVNWRVQDGASTFLKRAASPTGHVGRAMYLPMVAGEISLQLEGTGTLTASMLSGRLMSITLTGAGDLSAAGALIVAMVAAMGGTSTLTASIAGRIGMVCSIGGTGDLDATASGTAALVAALGGEGGIDALITAFGDMSVDIVVTGAGITTVSVADAVWAKVLEAGFDAASILRIIAAATAGEASGAPDGPMVFKGLDGVTDRISGDIDGDGNRSNTTYDGA